MGQDFVKRTNTTVYQDVGPVLAVLVAGAPAVAVCSFDVTSIEHITISFKVGVAGLAGLEVWVRGDRAAEWLPMALAQVEAYGRNDSGTDITTTPVGVTGFVKLETRGWSDVQLRSKSNGASTMSITAGGK